jgi:isopentenyldiphosphate isomerase
MEYLDIVDSNNNLTGKAISKHEAHEQKLWHRSVHVWIYRLVENSFKIAQLPQVEFLIQRRAKDKKLYADLWDFSVAGHVSAVESTEQAVIREVKEELGIDILYNSLEFLETTKSMRHHEIVYTYLVKYSQEDFKLNHEVQAVKFILASELRKQLQTNLKEFVPDLDYWYDVLDYVDGKI